MKKTTLILTLVLWLTGCSPSRFGAEAEDGIITVTAETAQSSGVIQPFESTNDYVKITSALQEGILYLDFYSDAEMTNLAWQYTAEGTGEHIAPLVPGSYAVHISTGERVTGTLRIEGWQNP